MADLFLLVPMIRKTMTVAEAEKIVDIVSATLQDDSHLYGQHPISALRGHDLLDILFALKLRIANEFLLMVRRDDFEQLFSEALRHYDNAPWLIMMSFVRDDQLGQIGADMVMNAIDPSANQMDPRLASAETASSFGEFCKSIGPEDTAYWRRVYERIGLEYTAGHGPVPPEPPPNA